MGHEKAADMALRPRDGNRPSSCITSPSWNAEGAGKAGWPLHPGLRARKICASAKTTGYRRWSHRPSPRSGFTAYTRSPRWTILFATVIAAMRLRIVGNL